MAMQYSIVFVYLIRSLCVRGYNSYTLKIENCKKKQKKTSYSDSIIYMIRVYYKTIRVALGNNARGIEIPQ